MKVPWKTLAIAGLMLLSGLLLVGNLTTGHDWGDDFALYIMQAQSLVEGRLDKLAEENQFTTERSSIPMGPIFGPWGFPLLLAPMYAIFGMKILALKLVVALFFMGFLLLLWKGFRKKHSAFWRLVLVGIFAFNLNLIQSSDQILPDIPFLFFSTFSVLLLGRVVVKRKLIFSPVYDHILLGVSMAFASSFRSNGILLLGTLGFYQMGRIIRTLWLIRKDQKIWSLACSRILPKNWTDVQRLCIQILPYASFVSVRSVEQALLPGDSVHSQMFLSYIQTFPIKNILHLIGYYTDVPVMFFEGAPHYYLFYGASLPLCIAGGFRRYKQDMHVILYGIFTLALYLVWPYVQGIRYIYPVLPFYISFALTGMEAFSKQGNRKERFFRQSLCYVVIIGLLAPFGTQLTRSAYENLLHHRKNSSGPFVETSASLFQFIKEHVAPDQTVVFFKPRVLRMLTGRRSLMLKNLEELGRHDYVCIYHPRGGNEQVPHEQMKRLVEQGLSEVVYTNSEFTIYYLTDAFPLIRKL